MIPDPWVAKIQAWARAEALVREVWVFGSWARGENTEGSDLDLAAMLECEPEHMLVTWIENAKRWREQLGSELPRDLVIQLEPGDLELAPEIVNPAVVSEGHRIF